MIKLIAASELQIAEDLKDILARETKALALAAKAGGLVKEDFMKLEKVTKSYTMLMADLRETVKSGILAHLEATELEKLAKERDSDFEQLDKRKNGSRGRRKAAGNNKAELHEPDGKDEITDDVL